MNRANGTLVKFHQHGHKFRGVTDDLATQPISQLGPRRVSLIKKRTQLVTPK